MSVQEALGCERYTARICEKHDNFDPMYQGFYPDLCEGHQKGNSYIGLIKLSSSNKYKDFARANIGAKHMPRKYFCDCANFRSVYELERMLSIERGLYM